MIGGRALRARAARTGLRCATAAGGVLAAALALLPAARGEQAPLVQLVAAEAELELARVPDTETLCAAGALVRFSLARAARVSLTVGGGTATGAFDEGPRGLLSGVRLGPGLHSALVTAERRRSLGLGERAFALAALESDAGQAAVVTGVLRDERIDRPVLLVGRTFVSGVDLLSGHLVLQATDLKLEGRHLALELTRTYSSAGRSAAGLAGAGWRLNYESALTPLPECGLALVRTADGGPQAFLAAADGSGFRPQRGYHTRLRRNADGSFDFFDKAAVQHHFAGRAAGSAASLRLVWIEEPHGDRIALEYDAGGRLRRVSESHPRLGPVRTLLFSYASAGGMERVSAARAWGLGTGVDYRYDAFGNLVQAERSDREDAAASDTYEYSTSDTRDPHQLVAAAPSGEGRTRYSYGPAPAPFSPQPAQQEDAADPRELVREVSPPGQAPTRFRFDRSRAASAVFRTEVRADDGPPTRYLLNPDGNPLEIDEPQGAARLVTRFTWDAAHVVKTGEENSAGRKLAYRHDDSGNLTMEQEVAKPGAPPRTTSYSYDPRFNKLVHKQDADGRVSTWTLDPATGDLIRQEEPDGTLKSWAYDRQGCLREERAGGARRLFRLPDTFCNATEIHEADGTVVRRRYDERGRLMDETKTKPR